jgi:putative SOS response-associated peptidase YedK
MTRIFAKRSLSHGGLMSRRTVEGDDSEFTCAILTRDAAGPAAEIHTRMPIALPKDAEAAWLDPELIDAAAAIQFAREFAVTELVHYPVNPRVSNAKNEGADLIEPFPNPA